MPGVFKVPYENIIFDTGYKRQARLVEITFTIVQSGEHFSCRAKNTPKLEKGTSQNMRAYNLFSRVSHPIKRIDMVFHTELAQIFPLTTFFKTNKRQLFT